MGRLNRCIWVQGFASRLISPATRICQQTPHMMPPLTARARLAGSCLCSGQVCAQLLHAQQLATTTLSWQPTPLSVTNTLLTYTAPAGMGRWYRGEVVAYNEEEGTHTVVYADGETHEHVLRHESVKWTPLKGASPDEHCAEGDHSGNSHSVLAVPRAVLVPKPEDGQPSCNTSTAGAVQPATPVQLIESAKARPFHKTSQAAATSSEPSQQSTEGHRSGGIHCASAAAPHGVSAATVNRGVRPPSALLKVSKSVDVDGSKTWTGAVGRVRVVGTPWAARSSALQSSRHQAELCAHANCYRCASRQSVSKERRPATP
jgi:hypothetical protein